jgi:hypothetical protein
LVNWLAHGRGEAKRSRDHGGIPFELLEAGEVDGIRSVEAHIWLRHHSSETAVMITGAAPDQAANGHT